MTMTQMYWLTRLDGINTCMSIAFPCFILIALLYFFVRGVICEKDVSTNKCCMIILVGIIISVSSVFVPTTKEMAAIIVVPAIVNSEQAQEIPENMLNLCNEWIKSQTDSLKDMAE